MKPVAAKEASRRRRLPRSAEWPRCETRRGASADLVPGTARNRFASAIPTPPAANQS
jgi:hypothetical protein